MQQGEAFLTTRHEKETEFIGSILGQTVLEPLTIALNGELGAGKTVLVRGAARGLEAVEPVSSPTFVLMKIYQGRLPLYHFDFYRLEETEDLSEQGFDDYLPGDGIAFVEWAGRFMEILPRERLEISLERFFDHCGEGRRLWFRPYGQEASRVVEKIIETATWRVNGTLNMPPSVQGEVGGLGHNC